MENEFYSVESTYVWVSRLAMSVVEQVAPKIPSDVAVHVEGEGAEVVVHMHVEQPWSRNLSMGFGSVAVQSGTWSRGECVRTAVQSLLDNLQDFVALQTTTPWPGTGTTQPMPSTELVGDRIEAWFGDDRAGSTYPTVSVELPFGVGG